MSANKNKSDTPDSVTDREKSKLDDDAVTKALTGTEPPESGSKSVLPGPPIPPEVQAEIREKKQEPRTSGRRGPASPRKEPGAKTMIDANDIKEHMEVVGSDGDHVGTVDHCEGPNIIKLTKNDPAAGGEHHYIPLAWVASIDQQVHLAHPGSEARSRWG
jgi:hypothetical protein